MTLSGVYVAGNVLFWVNFALFWSFFDQFFPHRTPQNDHRSM